MEVTWVFLILPPNPPLWLFRSQPVQCEPSDRQHATDGRSVRPKRRFWPTVRPTVRLFPVSRVASPVLWSEPDKSEKVVVRSRGLPWLSEGLESSTDYCATWKYLKVTIRVWKIKWVVVSTSRRNCSCTDQNIIESWSLNELRAWAKSKLNFEPSDLHRRCSAGFLRVKLNNLDCELMQISAIYFPTFFQTYLIFVTGATGGARVNFFWPV